MFEFTQVTKALADENRLRVMMMLKDRELCVCQIVEMLGLAPSTVSKHMAILRQARLVEGRKDGRWIYYRRVDASAGPYVVHTLAWLDACIHTDPSIHADRKKLRAILKLDPEALCKRQARCA